MKTNKKEQLEAWEKINIDAIIENLDYEKIHELSALSDYGDSIYIWQDGSISTLGQGTTPNTDEWYAVINCQGRGNIDVDWYAEGWAEETENGDYIETETGKEMTDDEMIIECIRTGEWTEYNNQIAEDILRQYEEDCQNLYDMINNPMFDEEN